ncbi:O-antigen ligase family protein [Massilia solisilvae]|uniref:O-antigen ligase family protein n=1 Tax=Massilia solisilvae TaxID=1811225 RepID=A0ABT2BJG5_9BURK|nr:O-antigen ligase family protein [Massilia solisilvae]MCS0608646.1 O-antigen ligase family protein [Massilia solisilvae]
MNLDTLLIAIYTSLPFIIVVLIALLMVVGIGVGVVQPRFLAYPYLAVFFTMNSTSYGSIITSPVMSSVYVRGSGVLVFPLVFYYVLGAWCCARVSAGYQGYREPPCNLKPWFWGWFLLLVAHATAAVFSGVKVVDALSVAGFSNVVWMGPLVALLLLSFRTPEQTRELGDFIVLVGLARALFGLVRWAAFGGDPNNVYANMNEVPIKLTFFDINDSLVCTLAFAVAAVRLGQAGRLRQSQFWFAVQWATVCATALCVMLAMRRSGWLGFALAAAVVMLRFPRERRLKVAVFVGPLIGAGLLYAASKRLGQTKGAHGVVSRLLYDMQSGRTGAESERVLELKLALADFLSKPFTGIGAWGRYTGYERIGWQNNADGGTFVHSGVLHIALKTGLPGLVLLAGLVTAFIVFARRALKSLPPEHLPLATAGVAGIAFLIPEMLIGTPIPQVRGTQMIAICLALPYLAAGVFQPATPVPATSGRRLRLVPA